MQWQLRHESLSTLRHYVQELPLAMARAEWSDDQLDVVRRFARAAGPLRARAIAGRGAAPLVRSHWTTVRARHRRHPPTLRSRSHDSLRRLEDGFL